MLMDTTREMEELQNELWMRRTTQERAKFMFGMFAAARRIIIESLPKDLSDCELKNKSTFAPTANRFPTTSLKKMKNKTMTKKVSSLMLAILMFVSFAKAQTAEVTVSLNEQFFDALLDAIFKNFDPPEFPLAENSSKFKVQSSKSAALQNGFVERKAVCNESIRLLREVGDVRTVVRFRDGKIYAPMAFSGSYNPPLVGCIDFQGYAETIIDLEYDRQSRKLVGRVHVLSVNLGGITNLASGVLSKLVQSSIDKKINPIEILQIDKLSFIVPVQNANGSLRMKATGVRTEIVNGALNVSAAYEFSKN